jgi:hypothetical protein
MSHLATATGRDHLWACASFNEILPEGMPYFNDVASKGKLEGLGEPVVLGCGQTETIEFLDRLKQTGFEYATRAGIYGLHRGHCDSERKGRADRNTLERRWQVFRSATSAA